MTEPKTEIDALVKRAREWVSTVDPARVEIASTAYAHTNIIRDLAALDLSTPPGVTS